MTVEEKIKRRILKHNDSINKFRADLSLDTLLKKEVIFKYKMLIRELKWVLKSINKN